MLLTPIQEWTQGQRRHTATKCPKMWLQIFILVILSSYLNQDLKQNLAKTLNSAF